MRAVVLTFLGLAALGAVPVQAAPMVVPAKQIAVELRGAPSIEVRQGCGWGWHRGGWRDRWGYWRIGDAATRTGSGRTGRSGIKNSRSRSPTPLTPPVTAHDEARRPASADERCRLSATARAASENGQPNTVQPR